MERFVLFTRMILTIHSHCKSIQSTPEQIWIIHVYNMKSKSYLFPWNGLTKKDAHSIYCDHSFLLFSQTFLFVALCSFATFVLCVLFQFVCCCCWFHLCEISLLPLDFMFSDWINLNPIAHVDVGVFIHLIATRVYLEPIEVCVLFWLQMRSVSIQMCTLRIRCFMSRCAFIWCGVDGGTCIMHGDARYVVRNISNISLGRKTI